MSTTHSPTPTTPLRRPPRRLRPPFDTEDSRPSDSRQPDQTTDQRHARRHADHVTALLEPLDGVEPGEHDRHVIEWPATHDTPVADTIASPLYGVTGRDQAVGVASCLIGSAGGEVSAGTGQYRGVLDGLGKLIDERVEQRGAVGTERRRTGEEDFQRAGQGQHASLRRQTSDEQAGDTRPPLVGAVCGNGLGQQRCHRPAATSWALSRTAWTRS